MKKVITKNATAKIQDIDEKGVVNIYVNAFNNVDTDGEVSDPASFNKTIQDGIGRIKHLQNHDTTKLLGLPKEMIPDSFGLRVVSAMNVQKEFVKDVFMDYKFFAEHDRTLEHSIGALIVKQEWDSALNAKRNLEYALKEYSTLTFLGANPETPLVSYKNDGSLFQELQMLTKMIKGDYTKGRQKEIENKISLIQKAMDGLIIVTCGYCGLAFDYGSVPEITVSDRIQELMTRYVNWVIEDIVHDEMKKLEPEIRAEMQELLTVQKGVNLEEAFNHVRCPKCYSIVKKSLTKAEPAPTTQKSEPIDYKFLSNNFKIK